MKHYALRSKYAKIDVILTADKHFFASSARSTKRWAKGLLLLVRVETSCWQVAKRIANVCFTNKRFLLSVNFLHDWSYVLPDDLDFRPNSGGDNDCDSDLRSYAYFFVGYFSCVTIRRWQEFIPTSNVQKSYFRDILFLLSWCRTVTVSRHPCCFAGRPRIPRCLQRYKFDAVVISRMCVS